VLQLCKHPESDADGSRLLCRLPAVRLPDNLDQQLMISARGPGVAAYQSPDGNVRVDIYMGLKLDGLKLYKNISSVKMQFAVAPNITCPSDVLIFNPRTHSTITLQVDISYWLYFTHGHWYKKILAPLSFSQRAVFTSLRMLFSPLMTCFYCTSIELNL